MRNIDLGAASPDEARDYWRRKYLEYAKLLAEAQEVIDRQSCYIADLEDRLMDESLLDDEEPWL